MPKTWIKPDGRIRYLSEIDPNHKIEDKPLAWHLAGLQQTATGYGSKLTSSRVAKFVIPGGAIVRRRIYVTQYSNAGTAWIEYRGLLYVVD